MGDSIFRPHDTARALTALLWQEHELSRITAGWIPAAPKYEIKAQLGRLSYLHNQNMKALYERAQELPESLKASSSGQSPPAVTELFERLAMANDLYSFLWGYHYVYRRICQNYETLSNRLDPLLDAPTMDKIRITQWAKDEILRSIAEHLKLAETGDVAYGHNVHETMIWETYVKSLWEIDELLLLHLMDMDKISWPYHPVAEPAGPAPSTSVPDPNYPLYENSTNKGMKSFSDPSASPLFESVKQMLYINACEMAAAESLAYMFYGVKNMPLEFYCDLSRHLWDEMRHSMMGIRRLEQLGYDTRQFLWFRGAPGDLSAEERFAEMYSSLTLVAEPCSFRKKRKSAEAFWKFGDVQSAVQSEFDVVDERMHVDFGNKWNTELYKQLGNLVTARELKERAAIRRMNELNVSPAEQEKLVKHFPGFCGISTSDLPYDRY